jgi:hypothetical protein
MTGRRNDAYSDATFARYAPPVPSRKQRRRRQKERRHEYEYVYVDERGEEVDVDPAEIEKPASSPAKPKPKPEAAPFRGGREVPPPSWRRVVKRGLIFAPFMFITLLLLDRGQSYDLLAINTVVLLAFFLPFSYVLDTVMYRVYVKRGARQGGQTASRRR